MTVMQQDAGRQAARLTFERPVERSLVHRRAVTEVYVTDARPVSRTLFAVAAQLPRSHRYFTDHAQTATAPSGAPAKDGPAASGAPAATAALDPLLLTECCRQAATTVAHRYLGVPRDTAFLVTRWAARFPGAPCPPPGAEPAELTLLISTRDVKERAGRVESATLDMDLTLAGSPVGRVSVGAAYLPTERYAALRTLRRTTPPPLTSAMPPRGAGTPAAPASVGRSLTENVVLTDAALTTHGAVAALDVPSAHPAIYDHPLDHVPAMGLIEAARQAALYAACRGRRALLPRLAGFEATFARFAELDARTTVTARLQGPHAAGGRAVAVDFRQHGAEICAITVSLTGVPGTPPAAAGPPEAGQSVAGRDRGAPE